MHTRLAVAVLVLALPLSAWAEARQADRMTTTAGSTTLLRAVAPPKVAPRSQVTITLYGDHATVSQAVAGSEAASYEVLSPVSDADWAAWPGGIAGGRFPSFAVLAEGGRRIVPERSTTEAPIARLVSEYDLKVDTRTFELADSPVSAQRVRFEAPAGAVRAVWTVPYLGDSYGGIDPLDCSCGEPWNFALHMAGVAVDPRGGVAGTVVIENAATVPAHVRSAGGEVRVAPGARVEHALEGPFWMGFAPGAWPRFDRPATPLSLYCTSPQEDEGAEAIDQSPEYYARREADLERDRAAMRWEARCQAPGGEVVRRAPRFLRLDGSEGAWARRDWYVRGLAREILGGEPVASVADAPLFRGELVKRVAAGATAKASSTLASRAGRYRAAHLVDGDAGTAWCEGEKDEGIGSTIELAFPRPASFSAVALLPGYVKSDWVYEANAAPSRVKIVAQTKKGEQTHVADLALPASAELFAEGRDAVLVPISVEGASALTLTIEKARPGKYARDLCVSEVFFVR